MRCVCQGVPNRRDRSCARTVSRGDGNADDRLALGGVHHVPRRPVRLGVRAGRAEAGSAPKDGCGMDPDRGVSCLHGVVLFGVCGTMPRAERDRCCFWQTHDPSGSVHGLRGVRQRVPGADERGGRDAAHGSTDCVTSIVVVGVGRRTSGCCRRIGTPRPKAPIASISIANSGPCACRAPFDSSESIRLLCVPHAFIRGDPARTGRPNAIGPREVADQRTKTRHTGLHRLVVNTGPAGI